ncbi:MAG: nucleotidyltransferase family protein [Candidatus Micrarchaeia archaeon]
MEALILAGGFGKRLRPITEEVPKPLVPIAGKPILGWQLEWLLENNVDSIIAAVGYKKDQVIEYLKKSCKALGLELNYVEESKPLGTGGALKNAESTVSGKAFYMVNGDIITNMPLDKLSLDGALASISLVPMRSPFGIVVAEHGKVLSFEEKPLLKDYMINAGAYLLDRKIFDYAPQSGSIEKDVFEKLAPKALLNATKFYDIYWKSIDSIKDMEEASKELLEKPLFWA